MSFRYRGIAHLRINHTHFFLISREASKTPHISGDWFKTSHFSGKSSRQTAKRTEKWENTCSPLEAYIRVGGTIYIIKTAQTAL